MSLQADISRNILNQAIRSEIGIRVKVESTTISPGLTLRAKQILYRFKNETFEFKSLQIRLDPDDPDHFLWILRTDGENSVSEKAEIAPSLNLDDEIDLEL